MKSINNLEKWQIVSDSGSAGGFDYVFNPTEIESVIDVIKSGVEKIEDEITNINNVADAISNSSEDWVGESADTYIQNIKDYEKEIKKLKSAYTRASIALAKILEENISEQSVRNQNIVTTLGGGV